MDNDGSMEYREVPVASAYSLLTPGGMVLLCTASADGRHDVAPVAWNCPLDLEPVSKVLLVCDTSHRTYEDAVDSGEFAVALPTSGQRALIERTGSVSGRDVDKYAEFSIPSFPARRVDALIPDGVAGWLECRLIRIVIEGTSAIIMGEVLEARAVGDAWRRRLHYVREGLWYAPGMELG